jgi:hypothetical protein
MRCSVARLCERTVGRRVPPLWAGGGLLHTTPHCVVVTAQGAELVSFASHTERWLVPSGANRGEGRAEIECEERAARQGETSGSERVNLRRYRKPHCSLRWGLERAEHFGGWQRAEPGVMRSTGVGKAGCLLRDESSALPMTAKLRHSGVGRKWQEVAGGRNGPQSGCGCGVNNDGTPALQVVK